MKKQIYVYPSRGFRGIKMSEVEFTRGGIKGNSCWAIFSYKINQHLTIETSDSVAHFDRNFLPASKSRLRVFLRDNFWVPNISKHVHILDLDQDYTRTNFDRRQFSGQQVQVFKESELTDFWHGQIFEQKVTKIRTQTQDFHSIPTFFPIVPQRLESEKWSKFEAIRTINFVNIKSINAHREDPNKFENIEKDPQQYRTNIIADFDQIW